ncbi:DgyrCDS6251 [Dimorphilus gyrociliatus]|uniref:DgyrCDS6251 n=1 Tax=Dimorphilus gyrociliatus TaxID=2664684 RepID=A0A7I8VN96_9ANNE|nr:DgyrCDS6251 [Dimorphilus gyrociliatus]
MATTHMPERYLQSMCNDVTAFVARHSFSRRGTEKKKMGAGCSNGVPPQTHNNSSTRNEMSIHSTKTGKRTSISGDSSSNDDSLDEEPSEPLDSESPLHQSSHGPPSPSLPKPEDPKVASISTLQNRIQKLLYGRMDNTICDDENIIRLHLIMNGIEWEVEKKVFDSNIFPEIRDSLRERGYDFEVMYSGYGNHADRTLSKYFLRKYKHDLAIVCIGNKIGPLSLPTEIDIEDYNTIMQNVCHDAAAQTLLSTAYTVIPPKAKLCSPPPGGLIEWEKEAVLNGLMNSYLRSSLEEELDETILKETALDGSFVFVQRTFNGHQNNNSLPQNYFDLDVNGGIDEQLLTHLSKIIEATTEKVDASKHLTYTLPWLGDGINKEHIAHAKYLDSLKVDVTKLVKELIDRKLDTVTEARKRTYTRKISRMLEEEIEAQARQSLRIISKFNGRADVISKLQNYLITRHPNSLSDVSHPVVLHGARGCGKSSIASWLAHHYCYQSNWTGGICILRHVASTSFSNTLAQLLRTLSEQLCMLTDAPLSFAYRTTQQYVAVFGELIKKTAKGVPLLIILDGANALAEGGGGGWGWIPKDLPAHVRLIITTQTDSASHMAIRSVLERLDYEIEIPPLTATDSLTQFQFSLSEQGSIGIANRYQHILQRHLEDLRNPMYAKLLVVHSQFWKETPQLFSTYEEQFDALCDTLELNFGKSFRYIPLFLACSRFGLNQTEMLHLLSSNDRFMEDDSNKWKYTADYAFLFFKRHLQPFLTEFSMSGYVLTRIKHSNFSNSLFLKYEKDIKPIRQSLLDYFRSQSETIGNEYNRRKFDEMSWQMFKLQDESFVDNYVLNKDWLRKRICSSSVSSAMHDVSLALLLQPKNSSLSFLLEFLQKCSRPLSHDGSQLDSQLYLRLPSDNDQILNDAPAVRKMRDECIKSPCTPLLTPKPPCLPYYSNVEDEKRCSIMAIFRVKNSRRHIVVLEKEGRLRVINTSSGQTVRTLSGLNEPKNVKMSSTTKAVVLCDRELMVYDLNNGELLTKLKGVLNLFMPFFGIHNEEHVIALSRNRMYINVINASSGDVIATFKAGEDRFLDSLLVSDNGQKCVCGDEVQKPFPLLVWDLVNRRLIHDLRIPGNDFITKISAIDAEGRFIVCACKEIDDPTPYFLIVYDLHSGVLFKKWKPNHSPTCVAITPETVISGQEDGLVLVWDLISGILKYELRGHCDGPTHISLNSDNTKCVTFNTSGRDNSIRLWDVKHGELLASFCPDKHVTCCEISADGNQIFIGLTGYDDIITLSVANATIQDDNETFGDQHLSGKVFDLSNEKKK